MNCVISGPYGVEAQFLRNEELFLAAHTFTRAFDLCMTNCDFLSILEFAIHRINAGEAAGQTIFHCHVHLIPRIVGDVVHPWGGVRGVVPAKRDYGECLNARDPAFE